MAWIPSDRRTARQSMARKVKNRYGAEAWKVFKETDMLPAKFWRQLDVADREKAKSFGFKPSNEARKAAKKSKASTAPVAKAKPAPSKPKAPAKRVLKPDNNEPFSMKEVVMGIKSDPDAKGIVARMSQGQLSEEDVAKLQVTSSSLATNDMPDDLIVEHYRSGIFAKMGKTPEQVAEMRVSWRTGEPVPLWAVPTGTPMALYYQGEDQPQLIGRMLDHEERQLDGMDAKMTFSIFQDEKGQVYEIMDALLGDYGSYLARHPSFVAFDQAQTGPIKGLSLISSGYQGPNFYSGANAGPSSVGEEVIARILDMMRQTTSLISVATPEGQETKRQLLDVKSAEEEFRQKAAARRKQMFEQSRDRVNAGT